MPLTDVPTLEDSIEIDAPPAAVWALVSDPRNQARWSPQTAKTIVRGGSVSQGTKMININRDGIKVWPTQSQIVRFTPEKEIAWRIRENWTVWSFTLEPTADGGTRLTERREAPKGISDLSVRLTKVALGGVENFTNDLKRGITETLAKIKADAEK